MATKQLTTATDYDDDDQMMCLLLEGCRNKLGQFLRRRGLIQGIWHHLCSATKRLWLCFVN